jgi:hypothetical protein
MVSLNYPEMTGTEYNNLQCVILFLMVSYVIAVLFNKLTFNFVVQNLYVLVVNSTRSCQILK